MEAAQSKPSPFAPADSTPLLRVPPLAPSQELAYRKKCIALKRRLEEIESQNDDILRRIETEKQFHNKMRLNRAILLNHLKDLMETPSQKISQSELEKLAGTGRIAERLGSSRKKQPLKAEEYLLDDSTEESEGDDIPEPQERPTRNKRGGTNPSNRDSILANNLPPSVPVPAAAVYQQNTLPNLAPAGASFSPDVASREPQMLTSSFRVSASTPSATAHYSIPQTQPSILTSPYQPHHLQPAAAPSQALAPLGHGHLYSGPGTHDSSAGVSSPVQPPPFYQQPGPPQQTHYAPPSVPPTSAPVQQPVHPDPPFAQFTDHMRPQLENDNYPADEIEQKIRDEWMQLSMENRELWEERYKEQMREYERDMDLWKRAQRAGSGGGAGGGKPVVNGAFSTVNR